MRFPKRHISHVSEKKALQILGNLLPKQWIIRELTERDYGIDLYVEIVSKSGFVTGHLLALQVKGVKNVKFNKNGQYRFTKVKVSTINYWLGLPVPVFVILVDLEKKVGFWSSVEVNQREGTLGIKGQSPSILFTEDNNLSHPGLALFHLYYLRERRWPDVEKAMIDSVMTYNSIGPFVLICRRSDPKSFCSTTIQYFLNQQYENHCLLARYLNSGCKKPEPLPFWYERHMEFLRLNVKPGSPVSLTFSFQTVMEMIRYFILDYRECILYAYELITNVQKDHYSRKFPYLLAHLQVKPHTFLAEDWIPRYFHDEYENETQYPERLFFSDFSVFDGHLEDLIKS